MKIYLFRLRRANLKPNAISKYCWRWQMVHDNGTIIANSILYVNRQTADKSIAKVREDCALAPLEIIMET